MTAAALNNRHTASLVCLWEKYFERNTVRAGGRYLGNDMDCHLLQQGPVSAPVSIFWRFAVASVTMLAILLATRRLRPLALRDHLFCVVQGCCVFCFNFWCFYTAAAHINTGLESVIFPWRSCLTPSTGLFSSVSSRPFVSGLPPRLASWGLSRCSGTICSVTGSTPPCCGELVSARWEPTVFSRQYAQYAPPAPWSGNPDHQQLGDALRHPVMGAIALVRGDDFTPQWTLSYMGALLYRRCSDR